ncbi:MAG: acetyl-CoA carboxylase biotin carboxyl carrier protein subunit [Candidatus Limnocylindria bacterium]
MRDEVELVIGDQPIAPDPGWQFAWVDRSHGEATLRRDGERASVLIEGGPTEWMVTIRGRRIPITVRSHRDRLLAESTQLAGRRHGPAEVRATLPGLVVTVAVHLGDVVAEGDVLLTVEAMKMQNEIRAPRRGLVTSIEVLPGQVIATGALLVRLADPEP